MAKSHYIIDYETMFNTAVLVAEHFIEDEVKIFVVHRYRNDIEELIQFLEECSRDKSYHIGYNNLSFDSQISEYILKNKDVFLTSDPQYIANEIYNYAQTVINKQFDFQFLDFNEKKLSIPVIDVFKLNNWDNPAMRSSLKWIQYTTDWKNMQEMPLHHGMYVDTQEQIDMIVEYCINDVKSTKHVFNLSQPHIALRKELSKDYNLNLMSASETKISRELFLLFLSKKMNVNKWDLRNSRTRRNEIIVGDILVPYLKFETEICNKILEYFRNLKIDKMEPSGDKLILKKVISYSLRYKDVKIVFGLGGIHGAVNSGIYESIDNDIIMSSDVQSFYSRLAMVNKYSPAHLDTEQYCEQYEWFFTERIKIPKKDKMNLVYKNILNKTYGLSNEQNCFLFDQGYTVKTTINGQLSLMMLCEMLCESIPSAKLLMLNTDGLEMTIPINEKERYLEICEKWEKITGLHLEHDQYSKVIIKNVNHYIGVFTNGKIKRKGDFEFEDLPLHKNKSFLIIPKAIYAYFINGISPEETILNNNNIFDYCAGVKIKGDWVFEETVNDKGIISRNKLSKVVRYYISNKGNKIAKRNILDGREIQVEAGRNVLMTTFNQYVEKPWSSYDINTGYYITKIYEEISTLEKQKQLTLF